MPYFSSLVGDHRHYYQPCMSIRPHGWFSLTLVSSHTCADQYSIEHSRRTLERSLGFSLCAVFSILVVCPMNSSCLLLLRLSVPSQVREFTRLFLSYPSLCNALASLSRKYARPITRFTSFVSFLRDHCCSLPDIQGLENCGGFLNVFCLFFFFFVCSRPQGNLVPVTPSWLE